MLPAAVRYKLSSSIRHVVNLASTMSATCRYHKIQCSLKINIEKSYSIGNLDVKLITIIAISGLSAGIFEFLIF